MKPANQPLDRAFAVIETVAKSDRALSITEIARYCNISVPSVHRIASHLEQRHLLKRAFGSKKFIVGTALVRLSAAAVEASIRADEVVKVLEALSNELGEHCQLGVRSGNEMVFSTTARAARGTGLHIEQGERAPLYCCSTGKLFLAEMAPEEFAAWLRSTPRQAATRRTLVSERKLRAAISTVREEGWAASNEELAVGIVGCAVPVRASDGRLVAGLGVTVPTARTSFGELQRFRPMMKKSAQTIAKAITG